MAHSWEKHNDVDVSKYKIANAENVLEIRSEIGGQQFLIENCKNSAILLLDHSATVTVDDCTNCLIVIGPCAGSVFLRDSNDCTVWAVCQQFRTRDCNTLTLALHCATQPIIENSRPITFHPIYLDFPLISEQMLNARLSPFSNNANSVHDFTPDKYVPNYKHSTKALLPKPPLSLLLPSKDQLSFEANTSFFVVSPPSEDDSQLSILYSTQRDGELIEIFFQRCLSMLSLVRREAILCVGTRDVLATRADLENCLDTCPEFNSGHLVAVYLCCSSTKAIQLIDEIVGGDQWRIVPHSFQETFRKNVDRLNLTSLSV
ncbi:unnamed protein product, partial [Mesorhabditis belari]|uniref:C-CAP/cofactor C-like domain-containing protein n=1 Tax=Mesorhabditis belari TaxID=2138241 RepID=A0AAF3JAF0_9BILA